MTAENFTYWLKGYFELLEAGPKNPEKLTLTAAQTEMIQQHLNYVFAEKSAPSTTLALPQGLQWPQTGDVVLGPYKGPGYSGGGTAIC